MKIGIIGSGNIGATAARLFAEAGHEVAISNSRGPESLSKLVDEIGSKAHAATVEEAERFGEIALVAVPLRAYKDLPAAPLKSKIVIDTMNYYPDRNGHIPELDADQVTSSELLARHVPGARVVKAFNTMHAEHLATRGNKNAPIEQRYALFVAGDDEDAKQTVIQLIEEIGFAGIDGGSLRDSRHQQPGTPVYGVLLTGTEARSRLSRAA
jgi:predicted dinucleotide-binding enzyme